MPEQYRQLVALRNTLESALQGSAGLRVHDREGHALLPANAQRQDECRGNREDLGRHVREGLISRDEALLRVPPELLEQLLHPRLDPRESPEPVALGLPASPGAASGKCVFDADLAEKLGNEGEAIILVREETRPEDIHGFFAAQGILTSRGGKTSHAAVVARGMGKPCVAGAEGILVDVVTPGARGRTHYSRRRRHHARRRDRRGLPGRDSDDPGALFGRPAELLEWADETADLKVMANADTPEAAQTAREYGAMGIGLCRTERMFNATDRLPIVIDMILANNEIDRKTALDSICCRSSATTSSRCSRRWRRTR